MRAEEERKRKEAAMTPEERAAAAQKKRKKEEAEARAKFVADLIKKRRFPIEDTKLHAENKEYGIKTPNDLTRRPALPHTLTCLVPPHLRGEKQKWGTVVNASQSGSGELLGGENDRGLIPDTLQVYHFFCGDVGFADDKFPVPMFNIKTLFYALDEVLSGNAKAAKCLPPLITHLLVTALRVLTSPASAADGNGGEELDRVDVQLQKDLEKCGEGLNAISWSQICFFYINLMERFYTSEHSLDPGATPGVSTLDMSYQWDSAAMEVEDTPVKSDEDAGVALPMKYRAYVGSPTGALSKAYTKLSKQTEPWNLTAEELMAILRALTDDILSRRSDLAEDIMERGAKLYELQKARTQALSKYRKTKLAFEGPKKATKKKSPAEGDEANGIGETEGYYAPASEEKTFKPTATKQEFAATEKAYNKAQEAYDSGIRKLISRTEPIGFDRNYNAYYCFTHDPGMLHVEQLKQSALTPEVKRLGLAINPVSSWHFIDTKPLFDQLLSSLDTRGTRENELYEVCDNMTILRRRLHDEKKETTRAAMRIREKEELERRVENARSACDIEDGRRSGRLAGNAANDLTKVEDELKLLVKAHAEEERLEKLGREQASDFSLLTGLQMIADLARNKRGGLLSDVSCHKLWLDPKSGGNGTIDLLVKALLDAEETCNDLSPWRRDDISREAWRKQLTDASSTWINECVMQLGPSADDPSSGSPNNKSADGDDFSPMTKKQKYDDRRPILASVVSTLRASADCMKSYLFNYHCTNTSTSINCIPQTCLKDLELRVFECSGEKLAFDEADAIDEAAGTSSDDEEGNKPSRRQDWKPKISALRRINTAKHTAIRDVIIAAITVARKAHLNQVAADLKVALQLYRPHAAGEAKHAAIGVLEKYGGYEDDEDEDEEVDLHEIAAVDNGDAKADEEEALVSTFLCDEVIMMKGSIGGDLDADKDDWSEVVKSCKSISRLAVIIQCFLSKAYDIMYRVQEERDALDSFLGVNADKKRISRAKTNKKKFDIASPVWTDNKVSDNLVKAKVSGYPWWPARTCKPYDSAVAAALTKNGYTLVSFVGESIHYVVSDKDIRSFVEDVEEDMEGYDAETIDKLNEVRPV